MATATTRRGDRIETVTTEKVVSFREVTLKLSEDEAQMLVDLVYQVGGPFSGRRGHANEIRDALNGAGFVATRNAPDIEGSVYFNTRDTDA